MTATLPAGSTLFDAVPPPSSNASNPLVFTIPSLPVGQSAFTAFSQAVIHFVYVTVEGAQLTLHAIDGTGQEFDSLQLTLPAP